jgi:hypothetical protein
MIKKYDYTSVFKWRGKPLDIVEEEDNNCQYGFIESKDGDWAKYEDHEKEILRIASEAFKAGSAYAIGSHEPFKQIHKNEKEYLEAVKNALRNKH